MSGGGQPARWGFLFSDLVVARRILLHEVAVVRASLNNVAGPPDVTFAVESTLPNSARDWDIQERRSGSVFVVEEVKSGPVTAEARRVLWQRIRDAVNSDPNAVVIPRLTTDKANPTTHPDRWAALPTQALTAPVGSADTTFTSAENLAAEALYCLTSTDNDAEGTPLFEGTPLTVVNARKTLATFEFHDALEAREIEEDIRACVESFAKTTGADQICNAVIGDIVQRAASPDAARRRFTPNDIWSSAQLLKDLSAIPAPQLKLWQALKAASEPPHVFGNSALTYQDWRTVQPRLAQALSGAPPTRLVLLGRGGVGKTVALASLHDEAAKSGPTLWINASQLSGVSPANVSGALAAGAVALCASPNNPLAVFVDGFENSASTPAELSAMVAGLGLANGPQNVRLAVSSRLTTWASTKGTQEAAAGWVACELDDWNVGLVAQLVRSSQRPSVSADLLRLLQTPLLLDLFLRTFDVAEVVPPGLQTRHAILNAFWERRVLPNDSPQSAERRIKLDEACDQEAQGTTEHLLAGDAAVALQSEGVFFSRRGAMMFRHALLRDFAMLCWGANKANPRSRTLQVLDGISGPIVRWGAVRAAVEASVAPAMLRAGFACVTDLLSANSIQGQPIAQMVADVVGELEDASAVDLSRLVTAHPQTFDAKFVSRVLVAARIAENPAWLAWLSTLPGAQAWPDQTAWVSSDFVVLVQEYLDVIARPRGVSPLTTAVAKRLRAWSGAAKFQAALAEYDSGRWMWLLPLVATHDPTLATLEWVAANAGKSWRSRWGTLDAVPLLLLGGRNCGTALPNDKLVALYLAGAGLQQTAQGIREDPQAPAWPSQDHQRTSVALLGERSKKTHRGLIREAPEAFLPVVFERLVGFTFELEEERTTRWAGFAERFKYDDFKPPSSPEIEKIEAQLLPQGTTKLSEAEALGSMVDDVERHPSDYERDQLVQDLRSFVADGLRSTPNLIRDVYWPAARDGRSATAVLVLIEALVDCYPSESSLLGEVLLLTRLFHVLEAHAALHDAMSKVWGGLTGQQKGGVLDAIRSVAKSPCMNGMYAVAPLASAIPEAEQPPEFGPYFELFKLRGWTARPTRRTAPVITYGSSATAFEESDDEDVNPWRSLFTAVSGDISIVNEGELERLVELTKNLLRDLPPPKDAAKHQEALIALERVINEDIRRNWAKTALLPEPEQKKVVEWALEVLKQNPPVELKEDKSTVGVESAPNTGLQHPFISALEILDPALVYRATEPSRKAFFEEIELHLDAPSETFLWHLLRSIRTWHWLNFGRETLSKLLVSAGGSPGVLSIALSHVLRFDHELRARTIEGWLTTPGFLREGPEGQVAKFCRQLGTTLGYHCAEEAEGVQGSARQLIDRLFASREGALSVAGNRTAFASGVVFGAKERLLHVKPRTAEEVWRFGLVCQAAWAQQRECEDEEHSRSVLYMMHPMTSALLMDNGQSALPLIWQSVAPVFVDVVARGSASECFDLVFQLREIANGLGCVRLSEIVQGLVTRLVGVDLNAPVPSGQGWWQVADYACELFTGLATAADVTPEGRDIIFNALQAWGARGVSKALVAARSIRNESPS